MVKIKSLLVLFFYTFFCSTLHSKLANAWTLKIAPSAGCSENQILVEGECESSSLCSEDY